MKFKLPAVAVMLKVVKTSTVAAAVPMAPEAPRLKVVAVSKVAPVLVRPAVVTVPAKFGLEVTASVSVPPRATLPPPVMLLPLLIVMLLFTRLALVTVAFAMFPPVMVLAAI